jgi:Lrp/AsnC family leucine-responsive transcriptional regulator
LLDNIDSKVIVKLIEQGRVTWAELGEHLGLSAPAAADRVRRLEERGVIRGYTALVDSEAVGCGLVAFIAVSLDKPEHRREFLTLIADIPEIQECHHVAGDEDYLLKVRCGGTRHLDQLISDTIKAVPGVGRTRTTVVLSTAKESPAIPVKTE